MPAAGSSPAVAGLTNGGFEVVFAGQDTDATQKARSYFTGYAPSSPQIALLRDGRVVFMIERFQIEGRQASEIARDLTDAFDRYCQPAGQGAGHGAGSATA